ncbi:hypothetical protein [Halobellus ruber]|uniref:Uncharacterized protein n=1 Tax=Halobellus ruber TaxID=2761102 RepID=A0A7J9SFZ8_9EURY|nr:hypothetical protein [Halobellus ruber]MBB6645039.1 hypothetical protein [Halobellus ruber]
MNTLLFSSATVVLLFLLIVNWRVAVVSAGLVAILAYFIGTHSALILFVGYGVLLLFIEAGTALLVGLALVGLSSLVGLRLAIVVIISIAVLLSFLLILSLSKGQKSKTGGITDFGIILLSGLLSGVSTFTSRIEAVGTFPSPRRLFKKLFSWFPGEDFTRNAREDFVERGASYVREGAVDVDKSPERLAQEVRVAHNNAGELLSDGEANIALLLAVFSLFPFLPENLSPPLWLTPPEWAGVVLSVTILVGVSLRDAALDAVLYYDVSASEGEERLLVMSDWNQYLSNGSKVLRAIALLRGISAISTTAYDHYLDWVLEESVKGDGASTIGLVSQWRELTCFVIADRREISPSKASQQLFNEDVFEQSGRIER